MKHIIKQTVDETPAHVADRIIARLQTMTGSTTCLSEKEDALLKAEIERDRMNDEGEDYHEYVDNNL